MDRPGNQDRRPYVDNPAIAVPRNNRGAPDSGGAQLRSGATYRTIKRSATVQPPGWDSSGVSTHQFSTTAQLQRMCICGDTNDAAHIRRGHTKWDGCSIPQVGASGIDRCALFFDEHLRLRAPVGLRWHARRAIFLQIHPTPTCRNKVPSCRTASFLVS